MCEQSYNCRSNVLSILYIDWLSPCIYIYNRNAADSTAVRIFCCFTCRQTDSIKHPCTIGYLPIRYIILPTVYFFFSFPLLRQHPAPSYLHTTDDEDGRRRRRRRRVYEKLLWNINFVGMVCIYIYIYVSIRLRPVGEGKLAVR